MTPLRELALVFLRLGLTSFGGPAAHVGLLREEFVRRRGWLDDQTFVDLLGAANLIPGPTSTELAMHIGHRRAGMRGLVVAGLAFLLPAVVLVAAIAWGYTVFGALPAVTGVLAGVTPVVVAIVVHAGWSLGRLVVRDRLALVVGLAALAAVLLGGPDILVLLVAGLALLAIRTVTRGASAGRSLVARTGDRPTMQRLRGWWRDRRGAGILAPWPLAAPLSGSSLGGHEPAGVVFALGPVGPSLVAILGVFLQLGAALFGSGYVLVALLHAELVERLGWLTEQQLLDAVAAGQATPGPLFSTATFVGWLVGGPAGAVAATIGIFLPAFVAVAVSVPLLGRLRDAASFRAFLDGVNAAALALLAIAAVQLGRAALVDILAVATGVVAFALLVRGLGSGWLILAGLLVGVARVVLLPVA